MLQVGGRVRSAIGTGMVNGCTATTPGIPERLKRLATSVRLRGAIYWGRHVFRNTREFLYSVVKRWWRIPRPKHGGQHAVPFLIRVALALRWRCGIGVQRGLQR